MGVKYSRGKWKKQHVVQQWNVELAEVLLILQVQWQIRPNQVIRSKAGFVIGCRAETFGEAVVEGRMLNKLFSIIMDNQDQCVHHQCTLFSIIMENQNQPLHLQHALHGQRSVFSKRPRQLGCLKEHFWGSSLPSATTPCCLTMYLPVCTSSPASSNSPKTLTWGGLDLPNWMQVWVRIGVCLFFVYKRLQQNL